MIPLYHSGVYNQSNGIYLLHRDLHSHAHLCSIHTAKLWSESRCPSVDEWMKKMRYRYTMEYYLPTKKNEICLQQEIMLSGIGQT
jgi:hypothetical protein